MPSPPSLLRVSHDLPAATQVVVYSNRSLALRRPGLILDPIGTPESRYRYRYSGLRLLAITPNGYVLLPAGWQKGTDPAYTVPADTETRIDLIPSR